MTAAKGFVSFPIPIALQLISIAVCGKSYTLHDYEAATPASFRGRRQLRSVTAQASCYRSRLLSVEVEHIHHVADRGRIDWHIRILGHEGVGQIIAASFGDRLQPPVRFNEL